jgi:hypothetical protein
MLDLETWYIRSFEQGPADVLPCSLVKFGEERLKTRTGVIVGCAVSEAECVVKG